MPVPNWPICQAEFEARIANDRKELASTEAKISKTLAREQQ
ncbi:MAG: hypothetical protein WCI92_12615 [Bacteroidota bacterium]